LAYAITDAGILIVYIQNFFRSDWLCFFSGKDL